MVLEIVRVSLFGIILFYAAINLGFLYPYQSQINDTFWVDAFFRYYGAQNKASQLKERAQDPVQKIEPSKADGKYEIRIPLNNLADSTSTNIKIDTAKKFIDTAGFAHDSLSARKDTVKLDSMSIDSTARLQNFHYQREDEPYVDLKQKPGSEFFAQPSSAFASKKIQIDSTGKYVEIIDVVAGQEPKILLRLPIDEYIKLKLALNERKSWESIANAYELKSSKKELGELIKDFTNFEIPLPSVGVLSIFGKPKISLRIGGAVDIHGAWKSQTTEGVTSSLLGNTTNEPDFQQQVQINVDGTIGDKLNINADWNTERTFEYENQLKIKYTGYEDEIIQSIEAGNVSLQTSPLVGGGEALFGVKANLKLGPLSLTALASQKKGQTKEVSVSGGATSQTFNIRAYSYSTNDYFVDTLYASTRPDLNLFYKYYGNATPIVETQYRIVKIEVWKSKTGLTYDPSKERQVNAYLNLPALSKGQSYPDSLGLDINADPGQTETGRFTLLQEGTDYTVHYETGYITFNTQIQDQDAIAVAYEVDNTQVGDQDDSFYGDFLNTTTTSDTTKKLVLKLIKPSYLKPQYTQAWKLLLKNIYPIGGRNIKKEGFEFQVKYETPGQDPVSDISTGQGVVKLLNAFGLDKYDASGNPTPDNLFDWVKGITVLPATGEIIFPYLQPFGQNIRDEGIPDSLSYQSIYDTTQYYAQQDKIHDKWELVGKYSGEATSTYQLGFNLVENSVRVTLNGRQLTAGVDYTVDYNIGQLTIINRDALVPGADLKITYEQNDLFQLASKTLLGVRGVFDFSKNTKLGFSMLNLNQQTLSTKVRIGEEPLSNTIMGIDFSTSQDLPFLTKALDHIISTKQMSSLSLSGEYAYMKPDPNTMKSTIPDDQGQSIAYIDDFEGAKKIIPVGVSYTAWKDLSAPDAIPAFSGLNPLQMMDYKAKSFWYSITPPDVNVRDIWGTRKMVATQDQQVQALDYVFMPDTPGTYNYNSKLQDPTKTWGGMMKVLSSTANDLQAQNIQYIEFWMHINAAPANSKLYIDLGRISEDVIPNKVLDTEDRNNNGVVDQNEDLGIDFMTDEQERSYCAERGYSAASKQDPSGDDFSFNQSAPGNTDAERESKYFHINGTEGNAQLSDIGRIPDTEDLNLNGNLDLLNSYFRYEVPIDSNKSTNPFIAGGGDNAGWYLIRIPLKDTMLTVGSPSLSDVEYIRVFSTNVSSKVHLRFAEFNLVGNQWQAVLPNDTVLSVSVINIEDNLNYTFPPGVTQERDKSQPDQQVYNNEQSLDLIINGLQPDSTREAVKYMYSPLDVFNYKEMKFFVHGDETQGSNISDSSGGGYPAQVYLRFGTDTSNFYEYSQPVQAGWNDVGLEFSKLTAIKAGLDSAGMTTLYRVPVPGEPGHYYGVKGNPSLTAIKYFTIGIHNQSNQTLKPRVLNGEVWIDELRVIGADNHPGSAYTVSTSLKLADLMTLNFNMSHTDPYFHSLSSQFGSRVDSRNWSVSADLDIIKLLPFRLDGSNFKVNYSHSESLGKPLYLPGTDIRVDEAAQISDRAKTDSTLRTSSNMKSSQQILTDSQTLNVSDTWSASGVSIKIPSNYWLIRDTFNALTLGFNYNKTFSRNPTILATRAWVWNANASYGINFSPDDYISPAKIPFIGTIFSFLKDYRNLKIYYAPQNFAVNLAVKRNRNTTTNRQLNNTPSQTIFSHDFSTTRNMNFLWKFTDGGLLNLSANYTMSVNSSLAYLETDATNNLRPENQVWKEIFSGAFFGKAYQYQQTVDFRSTPILPSLWDIDKYFQITAGYSASYQWNNNFSQQEAGRSAGFANHASVGLRLSLKSLMQPLFEEKQANNQQENQQPGFERSRGREFGGEKTQSPNSSLAVKDTSLAKDSLLAKEIIKKSPIDNAIYYLKSFARIVLFDYDAISVNLSSDNSASKGSLLSGGTGFSNFWGLTFHEAYGPSRLFMLGLNSDVGLRTPGMQSITDVYSQKNNLDFSTSKPLWEGAKIDLNWKVGWTVNKSTSYKSDANGFITPQFSNATGSISRSFLSIPPIFFLSFLNSGIKRVHELYNSNSANSSENLSTAFVQGFETLPWLSNVSFLKDFMNYIPRPNWSITWDGLEKYSIFKSFAQSVSLNHAYTSTYTEGWLIDPSGTRVVQTQRIEYGFSPLIGINITFTKLWDGNLTGNIKYSTRSSYDLGISTQQITETFSKDIGVTASYAKSGFEFPFFGLSLKNDIEFSFSYTNSQNSTVNYNMQQYVDGGIPQDGVNRVTIEPRVKYTVSSKVTLSIFYQRSTTQPVGASRIPPTSSNTAGLDVHISIQ